MKQFWDTTASVSVIEPMESSRIQWLTDYFTPKIQCYLAVYLARYVLANLLPHSPGRSEGEKEVLDSLESLLEGETNNLPILSNVFVSRHFIGNTRHRVFHPNLNAIYAVADYKRKNLPLNLLNALEAARFDVLTEDGCPVPIDNWKPVHHLMNILEFMVLFEVNREKRISTIQSINDLLKLFSKPADWDINWLTSTTTNLAKTIYETRNWALSPILGDALMDAGCSNEQIINQCKQEELDRGMYFLRVLAGKDHYE